MKKYFKKLTEYFLGSVEIQVNKIYLIRSEEYMNYTADIIFRRNGFIKRFWELSRKQLEKILCECETFTDKFFILESDYSGYWILNSYQKKQLIDKIKVLLEEEWFEEEKEPVFHLKQISR